MPSKRILVVTLTPVGPRVMTVEDDGTGRAVPRPNGQVFAALLAAGTEAAPAADDDRARYLPWNWGWLDAFAGAVIDERGTAVGVTVEVLDVIADAGGKRRRLRVPGPTAEPARVAAWFADAPLQLQPDAGITGHAAAPPVPSLAEQLTHFAATPGAGPQELGLVRYLRVVLDGDLPEGARLMVAPILPDGAPDDPNQIRARPEGGFAWPYRPSDDGLESVVWTDPMAIAPPKPRQGDYGPDLTDLWIRPALRASTPAADLFERCVQATNGFARAQEFVRDRDLSLEPAAQIAILQHALTRFAGDEATAAATIAALTQAIDGGAQPPAGMTWTRAIAQRLAVVADALEVRHFLALPAEPPTDVDEPAAPHDVLSWFLQASDGRYRDVLRNGVHGDGRTLGAAAAHRALATALANTLCKVPEAAWPATTVDFVDRAWRIGAIAPDPSGGEPSPARQLWLRTLAVHAERLWHQAGPSREEAQRGLGITIQLDDLQIAGADGDGALWDELAGVGVLLRRKPAGEARWNPWRLINAAVIRCAPGTPPPAAGPAGVLDAPLYATPAGGAPAIAVVSSRLPRRGSIFHPYLTYDHRSLVAESPLDRAHGDKLRPVAKDGAVERRFYYAQADAVAGMVPAGVRLPPLRYGDDYEVAVFGVDHGLGVPAELTADATAPWLHRPLTRLDGADGAAFDLPADPAVPRATLRYLRRVPVGALRVTRDDPRPDVVDGVRPLAHELEPAASRPPVVVRLDTQPLPTLHIGLPTVDVDVLERCVGLKAAAAARALALATPIHQAADRVDRRATALAFVDPAIDRVSVSVEEWDHATGRWIGKAEASTVGAPWHTDDRRGRSVPARLTFDATASVTFAASGFAVTLPRGAAAAVFRIAVTATADASMFETAPPPVVYHLLVERASPTLPTQAQLQRWLRATPDAERTIAVALDVGGDGATMRNVSHAEVVRHAWRWMGEPRPRWRETDAAPGLPWPREAAEVGTVTDADAARWEATAFVALDANAAEVPHGSVRIPVPRLPWRPTAARVELLRDDWRRDLRSQYLRYGVRLYSRYAPMLGGKPGAGASETMAGTPARPWWRSVFLPAVDGGVAPRPPIIGAVLPLTRDVAITARDGTAPVKPYHHPTRVLVVVMQAAFDHYGISEGFAAEVCEVDDHTTADASTQRPERGHDPLLWDRPWVATGGRTLALAGPHGSTLEPDSREPRFVASMYLLDVPDRAHARAWDFLRVRFRRLVADDPQPAEAPDEQPAEAPDEHTWTQPLWLQLGADAAALVPTVAEIDATSGALSLAVGPPSSGEDPRRRVAVYAVITRAIATTAATGGEAYLATVRITRPDDWDPAKPWVVAIDPAKLPVEAALFVRVLDVQRATPLVRPAATRGPAAFDAERDGAALWSALFPVDTVDPDARPEPHLRIVRVSPRVPLTRAGGTP